MSPPQLLTSPLLSVWAKLRLLVEPFVSSRSPTDESLADFVSRRLGRGVLDTLVAPMCAGIFAAPPENLSAAAAFLLIELENMEAFLKGCGHGNRKDEKPLT